MTFAVCFRAGGFLLRMQGGYVIIYLEAVKMSYGVPYQGSKNKICKFVIDNLPSGDVFVDLFAGGCAITHAAMLASKWNYFAANDIGDAPEVFVNALEGKYAAEKRWISRDDFARLKDTDPYVSLCWSFGNNRSTYLYAKEVEPWKKALHYARVFGDTSLLREMGINSSGSSDDIRKHHDEYKDKYIRWWLSQQKYTSAELDELMENVKADIERDEEELRKYLIEALKKSGLTQAEVQRRLGTQMAGHYFGRSQWGFPTQEMYEKMQEFMPLETDYNEIVGLYRLRQSLQSLQSLQRLQRLEGLENYKNLKVTRMDYRSVEIPDGAIVYADPPYRFTAQNGYKCVFNHEAFDAWLAEVPYMVIVSEYTCPAGCVEVAQIKKRSILGTDNKNSERIERLFVQERYEHQYYERIGKIKM